MAVQNKRNNRWLRGHRVAAKFLRTIDTALLCMQKSLREEIEGHQPIAEPLPEKAHLRE
jgi:hypothetical protein